MKTRVDTYFEEIKYRFIMDAIAVNEYAKSHDVKRNHVNYGSCTAWGSVLKDMGHDVDVAVYEEDDCLKISWLEVNGERVIEFEKEG